MGKKDNIKDIFKDAFESFEAPVDPSVWAGVQSGLSGAGSAGAGAAGTSLTAKIIGFTVAAAITTGVVIGIYKYTSSDDEPTQTEPKKELAIREEIQPEGTKKTANSDVPETNEKDASSSENTNTEQVEPSKIEDSAPSSDTGEENTSSVDAGSQTGQEPLKTNDDTNPSSGAPDGPNSNSENTTQQNKSFDQENKEKVEQTKKPLEFTASVIGTKGPAPLTVKLSGETNGSEIVWHIHTENETIVLDAKSDNYTFNKPGNYLIQAYSEDGAVVQVKEFLVEVLPSKVVKLAIEPSLLGRDKGVILTPNGFDNKELRYNIENEELIDVFKMVVVDATTQKVVFETSDISQRNWNGTDQFGEPLPASQNYYLTIFIGDKEGNTIEPIRKRLTIIR